jgi:predicted transcriptional regulator
MEVNDYWFVPVVYENKFIGFISKNKILSNYRLRLKNEILGVMDKIVPSF